MIALRLHQILTERGELLLVLPLRLEQLCLVLMLGRLGRRRTLLDEREQLSLEPIDRVIIRGTQVRQLFLMRGGVLQLALRQLGLELGHLGDACLFKRLATLLEPRAHRLERHLLLLRTLLDRLLDVRHLLLVPLGRLIGGPFSEGLLAPGLCLSR